MALGGRRPGAGRPRGSKNQRSAEIAREAAAQGKTPLEVILEFMRTGEDPAMRFEAAKAAAPYIHPKLANIDVGNKDGKAFEVNLTTNDGSVL